MRKRRACGSALMPQVVVGAITDHTQLEAQIGGYVAALGCNYLTAMGRKFLRGPHGTGFLYIREAMTAKTERAVIDHCAIVSFSMAAAIPSDVVAYLQSNGITIGTSAPNSTLLDAKSRSLPMLLRAALL